MRILITIASLVFIIYASLGGTFNIIFEYTIALVLVGFVGISHGSIDHILATEVIKILPKKKLYIFIAGYLGIIALYLALWFISPFISFILFLVYSAYHFGQADTEIITENLSSRFSRALGFIYGLAIISALMISNTDYVTAIFPPWFNDRINLVGIIHYCHYIYYASLALQPLLLAYLYFNKLTSAKNLLTFAVQLTIVLFIFKSLPALIAFSFYFGLWHSLLILQKEYRAFAKLKIVSSISAFILKLAPFTLVSLLGLLLIVYLSTENAQFTALIAISALAFPHTILMDKMYSSRI